VPVTLKDKEDKTVTIIGNFVRIDNGETEPMLFFGMLNIQKVQGILEPNKNQFRIKLHGKTYIIPTFSKALVVKDPLKEEQESSCEVPIGSQISANSSNPTSEEDLKKSV
jgi:hypothetical protein